MLGTVKRFSLNLRSMEFEYNLVNDCLRNVMNRGVMDLELRINVKEEDNYSLPLEVFTCKTIEKLKLGSGFVIDILPQNVLLPKLNTLVLDSVRFYGYDRGCVFTRLLSACPLLEELIIDGFNLEQWKWPRIVSSQTLKRLTLRREEWDVDPHWSESNTVSFDTPSLTYLEYYDIILREYPIVNLDSIVEAKLSFHLRYYGNDYNVMNMVKALKNVHTLRLDAIHMMEILFSDFSEAVPVFENLLHLSITNEQDYCWEALQVLLKKSPNLKTLVIEGTLHYDYYSDDESVCECLLGYSFLSSCAIEVLKINDFSGDIGEMVQIKHILEKLPCLDLLEVHIKPTRKKDDQKFRIMVDLLMLAKDSSKCKVKVKFSPKDEEQTMVFL